MNDHDSIAGSRNNRDEIGLVENTLYSMANYTSSWIADFFHSWPHVTFSFSILPKADYSLTNRTYYEALAMVALMAVVWLVLTMITFGIYLCCSKCKGKSESYSGNSNGCYCSVCTLVVFIIISVGVIGVAVYGNIQASDGLEVVIVTVNKVNHTFHGIRNQMAELHFSYDALYQSFNDTKTLLPENVSLDTVETGFVKLSQALDYAEQPMSKVDYILNQSVYVVVTTESYRRIATFSLLGFQCLLCFIGLLGVCCRSKCLIILMIVFGMICVTGTCFYLGADLAVSVALSDFCVDPYRAIQNYTVDEKYMTVEETDYYIFCHNADGNLLEGHIADMKRTVQGYVPHLAKFSGNETSDELQESVHHLNETILAFVDELDVFGGSVHCDSTSAAVKNFTKAVCGTTVEGFFTLAVAIFAMTVCMSFMVCAAASTGRRYSKNMSRSSSFDDLDYSDPFLPRNTNYNSNSNRNITRTNNPIYATSTSSTSNYGVTTNTLSFFRPRSDEDVSLLDSPPPYSPPRHLQ